MKRMKRGREFEERIEEKKMRERERERERERVKKTTRKNSVKLNEYRIGFWVEKVDGDTNIPRQKKKEEEGTFIMFCQLSRNGSEERERDTYRNREVKVKKKHKKNLTR